MMIRKIKGFVNGFIRRNKKVSNSFENRVSQHFLFNSLNTVVSFCRKDPDAAAELVGEISTYLQRSLEDKASLITLDEELEHVISYINIQKARFADRLKIVLELEENISCLIPAFTLQPVIDNAIRHGVLKRKQGGTVSMAIKRMPPLVRITVKDNGTGISNEQLASLFKRCNKKHSLYKVNHALKAAGFNGLDINSTQNEGTVVTFDILANL